jgi:hypothetical protein
VYLNNKKNKMMVYFTKTVANLTELSSVKNIVSPLVLLEYLLPLGLLQLITKRYVLLWLRSLLKHDAASVDVLNIVTVMKGGVTVATPKHKSGMASHIFKEKEGRNSALS